MRAKRGIPLVVTATLSTALLTTTLTHAAEPAPRRDAPASPAPSVTKVNAGEGWTAKAAAAYWTPQRMAAATPETSKGAAPTSAAELKGNSENINVTALPELSAISKNGTLTARSPAFDRPLKLTRDKKQSIGQAQVPCDATPGSYKIKITGHPNDPVMDTGAGRTTIEVKAGSTKNCADHSSQQAQGAKNDKGSNIALIALSAGGAAVLVGAVFAFSRRRDTTG